MPTGLGLRPVAKAPDEPPNPTGYAPPLDSTGVRTRVHLSCWHATPAVQTTMWSVPCKPVVAVQDGLLYNVELPVIGRPVGCIDLVHVLMLALGWPWGNVHRGYGQTGHSPVRTSYLWPRADSKLGSDRRVGGLGRSPGTSVAAAFSSFEVRCRTGGYGGGNEQTDVSAKSYISMSYEMCRSEAVEARRAHPSAQLRQRARLPRRQRPVPRPRSPW